MMGPFVPFDATGDGAPELFFGRKWPLYGFYRWDGIGGAAITERAAHAGTDMSDSTFDGRVVGDLDGDGTPELVIAFGPWHRFDLRVFRGDAQGELELVATRLVGRIGGMTIVRRGERRWLAVLVDNSCPAPDVFPTPPHTGAAPGVYFFEWRDGRLEEVAAVALPGGESLGRFVGQEVAVAGDFDGDGLEDLAFSLNRGQSWSLLLRQTARGFEPLMIAGMRVMGGVQLDEDPELELVVRTTEQTVLILGMGDAVAPPIRHAKVEAPPAPPALRDPSLVERWGRANDLAALAQLESAAVSLRDGAVMSGERAAKSALLDRAGALFASAALPRQVLALDTTVHDDPLVRGRAQARRAQALASLGRYEEALAEAQALQALRGKGGRRGGDRARSGRRSLDLGGGRGADRGALRRALGGFVALPAAGGGAPRSEPLGAGVGAPGDGRAGGDAADRLGWRADRARIRARCRARGIWRVCGDLNRRSAGAAVARGGCVRARRGRPALAGGVAEER
jgi:hypothetical protein